MILIDFKSLATNNQVFVQEKED